MKILHINSYYSGSLFYKNLYDIQLKEGLDIKVYVPVSKNIDISNLDLGEYTDVSHNHGKYDRLFFHIKHKKIYNNIIRKENLDNYDLIHAHSLFSNGYIAYKLYKKYKIPYIVAVRNTDVNVFFRKMIHLRSLGVNILKNAERIIFLSEPYKEYTVETYISEKDRETIRSKSVVIPNGIDRFWYENLFKDKEIASGKEVNIIYVGTLDENKNIETTIKACESLIEEGYRVNYRIVGRMKDEKYRSLIKEYSFIEYIEHCSKEDLINYYRNSDIFVMPSKRETFGLVYAEAMSQGLPVIYSRGQGFDGQFVEGKVGYSVRSDHKEDIVAKVKDILQNYKGISNNCIKEVARFDWDKISKEYINIYKDINS